MINDHLLLIKKKSSSIYLLIDTIINIKQNTKIWYIIVLLIIEWAAILTIEWDRFWVSSINWASWGRAQRGKSTRETWRRGRGRRGTGKGRTELLGRKFGGWARRGRGRGGRGRKGSECRGWVSAGRGWMGGAPGRRGSAGSLCTETKSKIQNFFT